MSKIHKVYIPQFAANDDEVQIVEIHYENNSHVFSGAILADFEASKVAFEIEAEAEGYLYTPYKEGQTIPTNALFCIISENEPLDEWEIHFAERKETAIEEHDKPLYTKKAKLLCIKHGLDISKIPYRGNRLTESDVLTHLKTAPPNNETLAQLNLEGKGDKIALVGAGPSAPVILEVLALSPDMYPTAIFDDNKVLHGTQVLGVPVVGPINLKSMLELKEAGAFDKLVIAINSNTKLRADFYKKLREAGFKFANIIHPKANISDLATIGEGNIILQFCNISPMATIGDNNYFSPYTSIEHDCELKNNCSFGPGVITSSYVVIEDEVKFGTGVFIEPSIQIGYRSLISSGSIITRHVPANTVIKKKENLLYRKRN